MHSMKGTTTYQRWTKLTNINLQNRKLPLNVRIEQICIPKTARRNNRTLISQTCVADWCCNVGVDEPTPETRGRFSEISCCLSASLSITGEAGLDNGTWGVAGELLFSKESKLAIKLCCSPDAWETGRAWTAAEVLLMCRGAEDDLPFSSTSDST